MPETWVYIAGGVIAGILIFAIAFNLISASVRLSEKQNDLKEFSTLVNDAKHVCLGSKDNFLVKGYTFSSNLKVLYATNNIRCSSNSDCSDGENCEDGFCIIITPVEKIIAKEISFGKNLCLQFTDESELRCEKLLCNITMQYIGSLPSTMDIWAAVNRILGRGNYRTFKLNVSKPYFDNINIILFE